MSEQNQAPGPETPQLEDDAYKRQAETDALIAEMFDGSITLVAVLRCGGCGSVRHVYPEASGEHMDVDQAREFATRYGWKQRTRKSQRVWLCPEC